MPKYSFKPKNSNEYIKSVEADNLEQATEILAQVKQLPITDFKKIYEVVERTN